MVKGFPFRLDKPTGEALIAGEGANYKSSAPAGQASKGALSLAPAGQISEGALYRSIVNHSTNRFESHRPMSACPT